MSSPRFSVWLWLLLGVFSFRVLAQFLQWHYEVAFLPPFDAWHSDVVPYPVLLPVQLCIVAFFGKIAFDFSTDRIKASDRVAGRWLAFGIVYMSVMTVRLLLGLTLLAEHSWFTAYLPTLFHFVLAAFVIIVGFYHRLNRAVT